MIDKQDAQIGDELSWKTGRKDRLVHGEVKAQVQCDMVLGEEIDHHVVGC